MLRPSSAARAASLWLVRRRVTKLCGACSRRVSSSPPTAPGAAVVMVPKKNGTGGSLPDYRPLNDATRKDSYPLPRIDESLDLVSGSSWFSSLTSAAVPGLSGRHPGTRQLLREAALGALRQVLERIRAAGLKLHPEKCRFMQREVTFLGHRVGGEGIGTWKRRCRRSPAGPPHQPGTAATPVDEVAVLSKATKGLWAAFESLRLCDCAYSGRKEPATGEEKWQVVVPKGLKESVLKAMHGAAGSGHFGVDLEKEASVLVANVTKSVTSVQDGA
ncbi:hypothetical protein AAFF_G00153070 [Aldrovandia affinis]|uniref:Uncharacterized protein n=1 Tax=Aldrovandia affinis TaxID=143900 RepID=A0AAD7R0R8_9TELE|nr:hypothetical protein AAFF_G00153070 [Aldrovandia affinis]